MSETTITLTVQKVVRHRSEKSLNAQTRHLINALEGQGYQVNLTSQDTNDEAPTPDDHE